MSERITDHIVEEPNGQGSKGLTRRNLLAGLIGATTLAATGVISDAAEAAEQRISHPRVVEMPDHNMPAGFSRSKILAEIAGETKVIGSVFFLEDSRAKAEFITKKLNPGDFEADGHPKFEAIQSRMNARRYKAALVAAGAFFKPDGQTQGLALQDGKMVGEDEATPSLNGILVIKNGVPSIEFLNQIPDFQAFLDQAKREGWDLFQQSSYIRPGGKFQSSNPSARPVSSRKVKVKKLSSIFPKR
jgi:hypothetical protein